MIFILVLFVSALTVSQIAFTSNAFSDLLVIPPTVANLFLAFTVCLLIVWLANFNCTGKIAVGINLIAEKLAAFSYTLYLSHVVTFRLLQYAGFKRAEKLDCQSILSYTFCIAASLITAYLLYWCFERQTPYIKKALKRLLKL